MLFPYTLVRSKFKLSIVTLLLSVTMGLPVAVAQWSAPYANSWIVYGKQYVKVNVVKKGIHRIPFSALPESFKVASPEKLQLWRRGKQVAILSTANNEILFYAVTNDGASDSLLYRPMSTRLNPYFSMYSDQESYFLTNADTAGERAKVVNEAVDSKLEVLTSHKELSTAIYQTDYSLSTQNPIRPDFFNSYFELGASRTGKVQLVGTTLANRFTLKNAAGTAEQPTIKLLVHGRSNTSRKIEVRIGKDTSSLRLVTSLSNAGFAGTEFSFNLSPGDIDAANSSVLALKSVSGDPLDRFSLAYYSVSYTQNLDMSGQASKEFWLRPGVAAWSRLQIKGAPANATVLDITDSDNPFYIKGSLTDLMVSKMANKTSKLLVTNEVTNVAAEKMKEVSLTAINPKEPNYLIITADNLYDGSLKYAEYRASAVGGGYKTAVYKITDIYNQFNYGEPSPVAIKKFMAYVVGVGGTDKNLFLIGKSITHNERMKRELPDEVPTIGYPASDLLLVEGFPGFTPDTPAVPVGRLSPVTNQNILDYLQKVKDYEANASGDFGWRKNVLHLNGGKNVDEISQLKGLLNNLVPDVTNGVVGGKVTPFVKKQAIAEVEAVNITQDVNNGAGMITYFGHGSPTVTDLDMGYITDASRGYNNFQKYPMMYFNGCGVGNIFSARFNTNPNSTDRITLSLDWLLAPNRGSIAIVANSFESFVSPASRYLDQLYRNMFVEPSTVNQSIGQIQIAVAKAIVAKDRDMFSVANVHQSLLQGDPVLRLVTVDKPDYALDPDESLTLYSQGANKTIESSDSLRLGIVVANEGRFVTGQAIPMSYTYFGKNGNIVKTGTLKSFPYGDTISISFPNHKDIQKFQVVIDPKHTISELKTTNNIAELEIDWNLVKDKSFYSSANIKDVVPPILSVTFDSRIIRQDEIVAANPTIGIELTDDRQMIADTGLVDIFIKRCADESCDFAKVDYASSKIRLDSVSNNAFRIVYPTQDLNQGVYELLVTAKDRSKNSSETPYRIRFEVKGESMYESPQIVVSPNPASTYVRFELKGKEELDIKSVRYVIFNQAGMVVEDKKVDLEVSRITNEWYWLPASAPSGLYAYKVILENSGGGTINQTAGKIVLVK